MAAVAEAKKKPVDEVTSALVSEMLDKRLYKVDFNRVYPMSAPSFMLDNVYYVSVIGDRVESYLPYFGRAYGVSYGGDAGLNFESQMINYTEKEGRKGRRIIEFGAQTPDDNFTYTLTIYPTGEVQLNVLALRRQGITFSGMIDLDPDFEILRMEE